MPRAELQLTMRQRPSCISRARPEYALCGLVLATACATGCASSENRAEEAHAAAPAPSAPLSAADLAADVEDRYVIGPAAARVLGYRIDWQHVAQGRPLRLVAPQHDSVFTLDEDNTLTRIRRDGGEQLWSLPVGGPIDEVLGITYVPEMERVYVTTGAAILVLDVENGAVVAKQRLERIANTEPTLYGDFLVYGARSGQVVWHAYRLGGTWKSYQVAPFMSVAPQRADDHIIAVGGDGRFMSLDAGSASQVWSRNALAEIPSAPASGNGVVYVASLDQHLRAFVLDEDRPPLWEYLSTSPLESSPVLIGDRVYQQIASEGLVCFEAEPADAPGGSVLWRAGGTGGSVLTRLDGTLVAWDARDRSISLVDDRVGAVIETRSMPQVASLRATAVEGGDLYAAADNGRIVRLVPRR